MANKDETTRALLDALCAWLIEDARFMPEYVDRLRDRFEVATSRGMFSIDSSESTVRDRAKRE